MLSVYTLLYFTVHLNLTEAANSIAIFFVGVAVTLFVVLVVFVSIWFYIRRRQPPKLSTGVLKVDTIEMQNETPPESSPNNQVCITSLRIKDRQRTRILITFSYFVHGSSVYVTALHFKSQCFFSS